MNLLITFSPLSSFLKIKKKERNTVDFVLYFFWSKLFLKIYEIKEEPTGLLPTFLYFCGYLFFLL